MFYGHDVDFQNLWKKCRVGQHRLFYRMEAEERESLQAWTSAL